MIEIFDTHVHYDDAAYDADREAVFEELSNNNVCKFANIATDIPSAQVTIEMIKKYPQAYGVIGIYPSMVSCLEEDVNVERLKQLAKEHEKVVAIGEIGLDYHYEDTDKVLQKKWFAGQMEIARELRLPIVVHSREAAKDTADLMRECHAEKIGGVIHCYSYTKEMARDFLDMGFYFGIGGVVTFKNSKKLKEAVRYIPLEHIVLETDAPYLTPSPYRGQRNSSVYLSYVAEEIARLKEISVEAVYEATWKNAHALYKLAL